MNWSSLSDFIDMGGYALYVWGSYLTALGAFVWEMTLLVHRRWRACDVAREHMLDVGDTYDTPA